MPSRRSVASTSTIARPPHVEVGVVPLEHLPDELGQSAGELDAGRAATGDHEGEAAVVEREHVGVDALELHEHVVAQTRTASARDFRPNACSSTPGMPNVLVTAPGASTSESYGRVPSPRSSNCRCSRSTATT